MREGRRGVRTHNAMLLLRLLGLDSESWAVLAAKFESRFQSWVGSEHIVM
ncbi:hypothetical protein [Arenicella xantha]|nr:hypothetical protein [Arenicella xantha]